MNQDEFRETCYQIELEGPGVYIGAPTDKLETIYLRGYFTPDQMDRLAANWKAYREGDTSNG